MRSLTCPHCGESIWLRTDVDVLGFVRTPADHNQKQSFFVIFEAGVLKHRCERVPNPSWCSDQLDMRVLSKCRSAPGPIVAWNSSAPATTCGTRRIARRSRTRRARIRQRRRS